MKISYHGWSYIQFGNLIRGKKWFLFKCLSIFYMSCKLSLCIVDKRHVLALKQIYIFFFQVFDFLCRSDKKIDIYNLEWIRCGCDCWFVFFHLFFSRVCLLGNFYFIKIHINVFYRKIAFNSIRKEKKKNLENMSKQTNC